jgi:predicted transcriptional regulator
MDPIFEIKAATMSSDAMKLELIRWLSQLEDKGLLNSLFKIKKSSETADWYDELTEDQRAAIAEGEADLKAGRVTISEDLWKKYGRAAKD